MPPPRSKIGDVDFVNDYVAKKQAQMQRAREIREERSKRIEEKRQQQRQVKQQEEEPQEEEEYHQGEFVTQETLMAEPQQHQQHELQSESQEEPNELEALSHNSSSQYMTKKGKVQSRNSAAAHRECCILQVVEEDFTKATQAGIITPDQARQLWAMFSDQVIRVVPNSPHVNSTVSIESLLALSNHTSASATTSSMNSADVFNSLNYNNTTNSNHSSSGGDGGSNINSYNTSTGFGGSISLESLRQSIANFKKEQKRNGKNAANKSHATGKAANYNHFDDKDEEDYMDDSGAKIHQGEDLEHKEESDDGADYFNAGEYLRASNKRNNQINTKRSTSTNTNSKKKGRKPPRRPEWNFDVGVTDGEQPEQKEEEEEEQHQVDKEAMRHVANDQVGLYTSNTTAKQRQVRNATGAGNDNSSGQRNSKKTSYAVDANTNNNNNNSSLRSASKGKSVISERKNDNFTSKLMAQHNEQEDQFSSIATPANNNNTSSNKSNKIPITKGRNNTSSNNASRFSGSKGNTGVLNIDDIPVGKATSEAAGSYSSNSNNVFANWDNAFPATDVGDAKNNNLFSTASLVTSAVHVAGGVGGVSNQVIEHEALAAAQEPLRQCNTCGRSFRSSVLPRHEVVCRKQANKKRAAFDMQSQRLDGVEGMNEVRRTNDAFSKNWAKKMNNHNNNNNNNSSESNNNKTSAQKMPKWKIQHEQFQAAMRAAHMQSALESGNINTSNNANYGMSNVLGRNNTSALPPPPPPLPPELDNRVLCPHCGRKFAEETAARHIPKCATTIAKPKGIRPIRREEA